MKLTVLLKTGNDGTKLCFWIVRNLRSKYTFMAKKPLKIPLFNTMNVPCSLAQIFPKQDRQVLQYNTKAFLHNHCCNGKPVCIKQCECVYSCLSYLACKSHLFCNVLYFHLWQVWLYYIFLHYFNQQNFQKKIYCTYNVFFNFLYKFCLKHFSFLEEFGEIQS